MEENSYPIHILPASDWKENLTPSEIVRSNQNAVIGRRIVGSVENCINYSLGDDNAKIREDYLDYNEIPNLSTSLPGGCFKIDDFRFWQKGEGAKPWKGGDVIFDEFKEDIDYFRERSAYFVVAWNIETIDNTKIPYTRIFPKKKDYNDVSTKISGSEDLKAKYCQKFEELPTDEEGRRYLKMEGCVKVNHAPVQLNYWHYTIDIYPQDTPHKPLSGSKGAWRQMMCENVADYLRRSFVLLDNDRGDFNIPDWKDLVMKTSV